MLYDLEEPQLMIIRFSRIIFACLFLFVLMVVSAGATSDGYKVVSAPEVKDLIEKKKALLINLLSQIEFEIQHIPTSINIPIVQFEKSQNLPAEKDTPIVLYCMGKR